MKRILVDTSAWYALVVKSDQNHEKVKRYIKNNPVELITPFTVFEETMALLQGRHGKSLTVRVGKKIRELGLHYLSKEEEREAWNIYLQSGKNISFVDSSLIALARIYKLAVLAFDEDFRKMKIELAV